MTIRKLWKKLVLVSTAIFWASCNDDNGTAPETAPAESSSSIEESNTSSSADSIASSSSSLPDAVSSAEEVSGSITVNDCGGTSYPYVQIGTDVRCKEELLLRDGLNETKTFYCCDGSLKTLDYSYVRNYTLLTDSIVKAEKIDSLNTSYCKQNGGVTDYSTYTPERFNVSSDECEQIAKDKAVEFFRDSLGDTENKSLDSCLETLETVEAVYGVIYSGQSKAIESLASVTCADGTVMTMAAYTEAKNSYDKKTASCEANASTVIDEMNTCAAGATASSSSTDSTASSSSEETEKSSSSSDPE